MAVNSRTVATRKKTAAAKAAPSPRAIEPVVEDDAALAQEAEADGQFVTALLADEEIRVVPPGAWRLSWQRYLTDGLFDAFASHVIHPDDLDLYKELDPTNDEFGAFVQDAASKSGEDQGKSRGPNRSTRRTRRR